MSFQALARLLLPADGRPSLVVETGPRWSWEAATTSPPEIVVWGRGPAPSGKATRGLAAMAVARERALLQLKIRPPRPYQVKSVHRWPPARLRAGSVRNRLREVLLGGAIVELSSSQPTPRVLDAVAGAAGYAGTVTRFRAGSGGSALVTLKDSAGRHILRVAEAGQAADPSHAADALERLESLAIPIVPRLVKRGTMLTASWTLETRLRGRRPAWVSPGIALQVAAVCGRLPHASNGPTALQADLDRIIAAVPQRGQHLISVGAKVTSRLARMPLVMRHGDLWAGNLLIRGDRLTGIVDWDSWHAAATPGTDLVHMVAADRALRTRREIGEVWLERPWRSPAFASIAAGYWAAIGTRPDAEDLDCVGLAWWAAEIGHALALAPEQAQDARWVRLNIEAVLGSLN